MSIISTSLYGKLCSSVLDIRITTGFDEYSTFLNTKSANTILKLIDIQQGITLMMIDSLYQFHNDNTRLLYVNQKRINPSRRIK